MPLFDTDTVYDVSFFNLETHVKTQSAAESLLKAVQKEAGCAGIDLLAELSRGLGVARTAVVGLNKELLQAIGQVPLQTVSGPEGVKLRVTPGHRGSVVFTLDQPSSRQLSGRNVMLWVLVLLHHSMP
jgi:hypothetical protein